VASEREARLDELLNREEIRACLTRFSRGMDRLDRELFLSAFHDDAEIAAGPFVGTAADCWDWAAPMHEQGQVLTQHNLLNNTLDIDGDVAHSETYYQFVARNMDESLLLAGGRYLDRLERRDGSWKIALRINLIEWSCLPPAIPLPFTDVPDIAVNGMPTRGKEDPSYQRPLINRRTPRHP